MNERPAYFEPIRLKASQRWDQLEQDPDLAGPWHQLFKQVQSPRHILSELLQNADDAGATEASVRIENQVFVFEHNGEDFAEDHFASLCRFGYSNKRALHTIGFRGIGFKSTFSLGDRVELFTPTLAIAFYRKRFSEPHWLSDESSTDGVTRIRVAISDNHRRKEVEKNIDEWLKSPMSLLFFRNIRRLQIGDREVHWERVRPGPIPDSEWMALNAKKDRTFLLLRSKAEAFPSEALTEIKQERMLSGGEDTDFPPCRIELVLEAKGRLYVVLPTAVETELPFACNAPFIQDPARLKIKDPETSPTNRWLLERSGQLAASAMLKWLESTKMSLAERAPAYGLLPDVDRDDNSLKGVCGTIVEEAFSEAIEDQPLLLTDEGALNCEGESVIIPEALVDIWPVEQAAALLDDRGRPALCQLVKNADRKKLLRWGVVDEIDKERFFATLQSKHLPRPKTWSQMLNLWVYVAPEITSYHYTVSAEDVRIVPVQGKDVLYAATDVVRLGEKKLLQSENDWEFLATHLLVLNQNWPRFLADQRRTSERQKGATRQEPVEAAYAVLEEMGLHVTSDVDKVIDRVAAEFFSQERISLEGCVQLAQVAAKLGATAGESFRYATRDEHLRSTEKNILFDEDGKLEELLPAQQQEKQLLHADYVKVSSCSQDEWLKWVSSGRSALLTFIPLVQKRVRIYGKKQIEEEGRRRGLKGKLVYPYVTSEFIVEDWDFDDICWRHWKALAAKDDRFWTKIAERLLSQRDVYWKRARNAQLLQVATTRNTRSVTYESLLPSWAHRLRDLPCLVDTRGVHRKPGDLLRRTPETESLMDVEPFVHVRVDREATRPLLDLLGVRSIPTSPDRLLDCLRALATAETPPAHEVDKWYRRLDQMMDACSTTDFQTIKKAFRSEKLLLTQDGSWAAAAGVFLSSDEEDVPFAAVIRSSVGELTLWRKIGIAERPTADLAIQWLNALPSGLALSQEDARRVRALLVKYPVRIWDDCSHWLNLAGEWAPTEALLYAMSMQSLIPWRHLHPWVKQKTADLQRLPGEVTSNLPFSGVPPLARHVEERFVRNPRLAARPEKKEWLTTLGNELRRIKLDTEEDTRRVRSVAETLARTSWHATPGLELIPYIDGTPAGTPRHADVLWLDQSLYVDQLPKAKLARRVPEEIGKAFGRVDIKAALDYSFERAPQDVVEYLEQNFELALRGSVPVTLGERGDAAPTEGPVIASTEPDANTLNQAPFLNGADDESHAVLATDDANGRAAEESEDDEQGATEGPDKSAVRSGTARKAAKSSIIERFAQVRGFRKNGEDRFLHEDGSSIGRVNGDSFPWEHRTASGDLVRFYWPRDHCLEREPLRLEADIWGLIDGHPETYALILSSAEGGPVEVSGTRVRAMCDEGKLILYPAAYRLVYSNGNCE